MGAQPDLSVSGSREVPWGGSAVAALPPSGAKRHPSPFPGEAKQKLINLSSSLKHQFSSAVPGAAARPSRAAPLPGDLHPPETSVPLAGVLEGGKIAQRLCKAPASQSQALMSPAPCIAPTAPVRGCSSSVGRTFPSLGTLASSDSLPKAFCTQQPIPAMYSAAVIALGPVSDRST